ncbi:hypothetical protein [Pseudomonas putida]|uniref:hypothetical protein n=1 Tax=Pseudomonas putida TaxID=303 RepID=UPI003D967A6D
MSTVIESTALDDQNRKRRLGSELWQRTEVLLDELVSLRAKQPAQQDPIKAQAMKSRARHAGATKVMYLEAAVLDLVHDHRPQLEKWTGSRRSRAEWGKKQLQATIGYSPSWRYIDDYLNTLLL